MAAADALSNLIAHLKTSLSVLKDATVAKELLAVLHDPKQLPNMRMSGLAAEAIDLLGEIDLLLEPGHMVLADHFLGRSHS